MLDIIIMFINAVQFTQKRKNELPKGTIESLEIMMMKLEIVMIVTLIMLMMVIIIRIMKMIIVILRRTT